MFDKKIKILLAIVISLVFILILFYFFNRKNNKNINTNIEISTNATSYKIKNQDNFTSEIKNIFIDLLKEIETNNNYGKLELRDIRDDSGNIVDFENFSSAMEIFIYYDLQKYFDKNDYALFYCPSENYQEIGIIFNIKPKSDLNKETEYMKKWEEYIIFNVQNVIYPNLDLKAEILNSQKIEFKDFSDGRFAKFKDNQGETRSMYYKITGNSIFITNSSDCFELMSKSLESL